MAAMDMEQPQDQQSLLEEEVAAGRRQYGRTRAWAAVGLGAALAGAAAALWASSGGGGGARPASGAGPAVTDAEWGMAVQQLHSFRAHLATGMPSPSGMPPGVAPITGELEDLDCEMDTSLIELCGEEEAEMGIKCQGQCVAGYNQMVAICPAGHGLAKKSLKRLEACGVRPQEPKKQIAAERTDLQHELPSAEVMSKRMECMPLMLQMAATCKMDTNPQPADMCEDACQSAIKQLEAKCADIISPPGSGEEFPLTQMTAMCGGCSEALAAVATDDGPGRKACKLGAYSGLENMKHSQCTDECKGYLCSIMAQCKEGANVPGMDGHAVGEIRSKLAGVMDDAKCSCH